jgi:hypothetical protein
VGRASCIRLVHNTRSAVASNFSRIEHGRSFEISSQYQNASRSKREATGSSDNIALWVRVTWCLDIIDGTIACLTHARTYTCRCTHGIYGCSLV